LTGSAPPRLAGCGVTGRVLPSSDTTPIMIWAGGDGRASRRRPDPEPGERSDAVVSVDNRELGPAARRGLTQPQVLERLAGRHLGGEGPNQVSETASGRLLRARKQQVKQQPVLLVVRSRSVQ
jgi:hypothetical protein